MGSTNAGFESGKSFRRGSEARELVCREMRCGCGAAIRPVAALMANRFDVPVRFDKVARGLFPAGAPGEREFEERLFCQIAPPAASAICFRVRLERTERSWAF